MASRFGKTATPVGGRSRFSLTPPATPVATKDPLDLTPGPQSFPVIGFPQSRLISPIAAPVARPRPFAAREPGDIVTNRLPANVGGGVWLSELGDPSQIILSPTARDISNKTKEEIRGGTFAETLKEVNHIISVGLGGTNDRGNLNALQDEPKLIARIQRLFGKDLTIADMKERQGGRIKVETQAIQDVKDGKISVNEAVARLKAFDFLQESIDNTNFRFAAEETVRGLFDFANKEAEKFKLDVKSIIDPPKKPKVSEFFEFLQRSLEDVTFVKAPTAREARAFLEAKQLEPPKLTDIFPSAKPPELPLPNPTFFTQIGEELESIRNIPRGFMNLVNGLKLLPKKLRGTVLMGIQGGDGATVADRGFFDKVIKGDETEYNEFLASIGEDKKLPFAPFGISTQDLAELPSNLSFTLASMGTGIGTGIATSFVATPIGGWAAGVGASGVVAYRISEYEITQRYLEAAEEVFQKEFGRGITLEEENILKETHKGLFQRYATGEALPEALGQALQVKLLMSAFGGKQALKAVMPKVIQGILSGAGLYGGELTTETITQMIQNDVEFKLGLSKEDVDFTDPNDWMGALEQVAPQTFLLTTVIGGAGGTFIASKTQLTKISDSLKSELGTDHPFYQSFKNSLQGLLKNEGGYVRLPGSDKIIELTPEFFTHSIDDISSFIKSDPKRYGVDQSNVDNIIGKLEKIDLDQVGSIIEFEETLQKIGEESGADSQTLLAFNETIRDNINQLNNRLTPGFIEEMEKQGIVKDVTGQEGAAKIPSVDDIPTELPSILPEAIPGKKEEPISEELKPLAEEARKFDTAEEFVESQGEIISHSSPKTGKPTFDAFFGTEEFVKSFPKEFGEEVTELVLPKNTNILDLNKDSKDVRQFMADTAEIAFPDDKTGFVEELLKGKTEDFYTEVWTDKNNILPRLKELGFDGVKFQEEFILTKQAIDSLKTKQQLTDIFNQVKREKPVDKKAEPIPKELKPLAEIVRKFKTVEEFENAFVEGEFFPGKALLTDIEISKLTAGEPTGAFARKRVIGRKILEPIDVVFDIIDQEFRVADGHNRFAQAIANKDKTIKARIHAIGEEFVDEKGLTGQFNPFENPADFFNQVKGITVKVPDDLQSLVERVKGLEFAPLEQSIKKFESTGSAVIAKGNGIRLTIKDEGDFINVGLDADTLTPTDVDLPSRNFSTKKEAIEAVTNIFNQVEKRAEPKEVRKFKGVKEEFKVGDIIDPQGGSNMVGRVTIRKIKGNSLFFTDSQGTDFAGMARSTVRNLIAGGAWRRVDDKLQPIAKREKPKTQKEKVKEAIKEKAEKIVPTEESDVVKRERERQEKELQRRQKQETIAEVKKVEREKAQALIIATRTQRDEKLSNYKRDLKSRQQEALALVELLPEKLQGRMKQAIIEATTDARLNNLTRRVSDRLDKFNEQQAILEAKGLARTAKIAKTTTKYQRLIDNIVKEYDFKRPTETTKARLRATRQFLEQNEDHPIPQKYIDEISRLEKIRLRDLSTKDIRAFNDTIRSLIRLGIEIQKHRIIVNKLHFKNELSKATEKIVNLDTGNDQLDRAQAVTNAFEFTFRVADKTDGSQIYKGYHAEFVKDMGEDVNHADINQAERMNQFWVKHLETSKFTLSEKEQKEIAAHLWHDQGGEDMAGQILKDLGIDSLPGLSDQQKQVQSLLKGLVGEKTTKIQPLWETTMVDEKGRPMAFDQVEGYFPFFYEEQASDLGVYSIVQDHKAQSRILFGSGFSRKPGVNLTPRTDVYKMAQEAVAKQELFLNLQPDLFEKGTIFKTKDYQEKAGRVNSKYWVGYVDEMARNGFSSNAVKTPLDGFMRKGRQNISRGLLDLSFTTTAIQPIAIFDAAAYMITYLPKITVFKLMNNFVQSFVKPNFARKTIERSLALRTRKGGEEVIASFGDKRLKKGAKLPESTWEKLVVGLKSPFALLQFFDIRTAAAVQKTAVDELAKVMPAEQARAEADFIMDITSGSANVAYRPRIMNQGELGRAITTFQTFVLNEWGLVTQDIIKKGIFKGGINRDIQGRLWATIGLGLLFLQGFLEDWLRNKINNAIKGTDFEANTFAESSLLYLPERIPVVGSIVKGIQYQKAGLSVPIVGITTQILTGVTKAVESEKPSTKLKRLSRSIEAAMILFLGTPGTKQEQDFLEGFINQSGAFEIADFKAKLKADIKKEDLTPRETLDRIIRFQERQVAETTAEDAIKEFKKASASERAEIIEGLSKDARKEFFKLLEE